MSTHTFCRSFRVTASRELFPGVLELLEAEGFRAEEEPFSPTCMRLLAEPFPLGASLAALFGYIYIQDRSSMLPPLLLNPPPGSVVADMAASPGSKSGFLAQLVGSSGAVLANEPSGDRLATLRANMSRANFLQVATCQYAGEKMPLDANSWSFIALDPPCSGWGTAAKHPQTLRLWRGDKTLPLIALQRCLIRRASEVLAPGGRILYSTCTTNKAENEEQIEWACNELPLTTLPLPEIPGFVLEEKPRNCLLVNGIASASQGFFLSLLTKTGAAANKRDRPAAPVCRFRLLNGDALANEVFDPALLPPGYAAIFGDSAEKVRFLPLLCEHFPPALKWQGALLGQYKRGLFTPAPHLRCALPVSGPRITFDSVQEIRSFLSGASWQTDLKTNLAGIWYKNLPLGSCRLKNGRALAPGKVL